MDSNKFYSKKSVKLKTCVPANNRDSDCSSSEDDDCETRKDAPYQNAGIQMIVMEDREIFNYEYHSDSSESRWPKNIPLSDVNKVIPETDVSSTSASPSPVKPKPKLKKTTFRSSKVKFVFTSDRYSSRSRTQQQPAASDRPHEVRVVPSARRKFYFGTSGSGSDVPSKKTKVLPSKRATKMLQSAVSSKENKGEAVKSKTGCAQCFFCFFFLILTCLIYTCYGFAAGQLQPQLGNQSNREALREICPSNSKLLTMGYFFKIIITGLQSVFSVLFISGRKSTLLCDHAGKSN